MFYEFSDSKYRFLKIFRKQLIPIVEYKLQIIDRVKLLVNRIINKSTIKEMVNSEIFNDKILVFATYPGDSLHKSHLLTLEIFEKSGYKVLIVSNDKNIKTKLADRISSNWGLISRYPFGRDFGCYKDATIHILNQAAKNNVKIKRVVYLNDSIYMINNIQSTIQHLTNEKYNFSGLTENYEFDYHVGSFAIGISGDVFYSKNVVKFWRKYNPISTRRYSIHKGEMGLSKAIKKAGYSPSVLYKLSDYKSFLDSLDLSTINHLYSLQGPGFNRKVDEFIKILNNEISIFIGDESNNSGNIKSNKSFFKYKTKSEKITNLDDKIKSSATDFDHEKLCMVRYRERFLNINEDMQSKIITANLKQILTKRVIDYIFNGSQIHLASIILLYMGAGILKKDVIYREIIYPETLTYILRDSKALINSNDIYDVETEILSKGHPLSFRKNAWKRLMFEWGFI